MIRTSIFASGRMLVAFSAVALLTLPAFAGGRDRPITKLTFDPDLPRVELFEGIDEEVLEVRVLARGAEGGRVLVRNTTDQPISVQLP